VCFLRWVTNPLFLGTYSYAAVNSSYPLDPFNLGEPLRAPTTDRPIVFFAGEATSQKCYSTVHGARESGLREAKRILDISNN